MCRLAGGQHGGNNVNLVVAVSDAEDASVGCGDNGHDAKVNNNNNDDDDDDDDHDNDDDRNGNHNDYHNDDIAKALLPGLDLRFAQDSPVGSTSQLMQLMQRNAVQLMSTDPLVN